MHVVPSKEVPTLGYIVTSWDAQKMLRPQLHPQRFRFGMWYSLRTEEFHV